MFSTKRLLTAACLTAPLLMPASANAIVVTDWNFTLNSAFTAFSPNPGVTGSNPNAALGGSTTIAWGTPSNDANAQSSLSIDNNGTFNGSIQTGIGVAGEIVDTSVYTHNNFVITGDSLESATLLDVLTLDPELPVPPATPGPGDAFNAPPLTFAIEFIETPNFWDPAIPPEGNNLCPDGVPHNESGCGDVFVLNVEGAGFDPDTLSFVQLFPFAGELYSASVFLQNTGTGDGLIAGSDEACLAAGAEVGCVAMVTAEGVVNEFQAALQINHVRTIPEPGVLALMALGLLAMGGLQRKRNA
ncbi:THxN family PEP-CTERM protein [Aestuariirhabdus sp. Z084]|uniref:THxN family PEP-CTERM protein n=1 Tax=Aestuariirhabdus haliotis TaxID=2918751 RepID=UPI00201B36CE|nr:THxN family PEP-CTERM protein [Aestuariirhabdus haliotis]MCL6414668.1 THxN family PEP-CTERM protein [Aestuariirhabdus haliotis]MCL6418600.1 THxN family PEP-CTERM protein [Aestuariirhabdus haliotis]